MLSMGTRMLSPSSVKSIVNRLRSGSIKPYLVPKGDRSVVSFLNPDNLTAEQRQDMLALEMHELVTVIAKSRRYNFNAWLIIMQMVREKII